MRQLQAIILLTLWSPALLGLALCEAVQADEWKQTAALAAPEAVQAAAADGKSVYAVANKVVARYDRETGERLATSTGDALHLNSGFVYDGKLYCAHSNYPRTPEQSEIKSLDLATMKLSTFKNFGSYGGSLTWCVRRNGHWWCNFARYGDANGETFLVELDDSWRELNRWTYPEAVIEKLGKFSLSGGVWRDDVLLVTGHDDPIVFRLRLPKSGNMLEYIDEQRIPFTGQGFAADPLTGGLIGINRAKKLLVFASP